MNSEVTISECSHFNLAENKDRGIDRVADLRNCPKEFENLSEAFTWTAFI